MIDVPGGQVSEGLEVLITGGLSFNGVFDVASIEHYDRNLGDHAGAQVRIEGRIIDAISGAEFAVNGFPVVIGGQRDYRQGSAADVAIGVKVRVEGTVQGSGGIQVHRVWFLHE